VRPCRAVGDTIWSLTATDVGARQCRSAIPTEPGRPFSTGACSRRSHWPRQSRTAGRCCRCIAVVVRRHLPRGPPEPARETIAIHRVA
jgi:hypothetical protein